MRGVSNSTRQKSIYFRIIVLAMLSVLLANQWFFMHSRSRFDVQPTPSTIDCGIQEWFTDSRINGSLFPGEKWGRWTKNGKVKLYFQSESPIKRLFFSYGTLSANTKFELYSTNQNIVQNNSSLGSVDLVFRPSITNKVLEFTFETKKSVRPVDINRDNPDFRPLGVSLTKFSTECFSKKDDQDLPTRLACNKEIQPDDEVARIGWYPLENWGRWSGSRASSLFLYLPSNTNFVTFSIRRVPKVKKLELYSQDLNFHKSLTQNQTSITVPVSSREFGIVSFEFVTNSLSKVMNFDSNSSDLRAIGVGIEKIFITC